MDNNMLEIELESANKKLNVMAEKINYLTEAIAKFIDAEEMKLMNVIDIAEMLGISPKTLYKKPWLLPNFGRTDGKMMWTKSEVRKWLGKGTEVLLREYEAIGKENAQSVLVGSN